MRAHPFRWFFGAFAAGALLAVSLVTCSRCCRADAGVAAWYPDPADVVGLRVTAARWRASR